MRTFPRRALALSALTLFLVAAVGPLGLVTGASEAPGLAATPKLYRPAPGIGAWPTPHVPAPVTALSGPSAAATNGGFETGDLTAWTATDSGNGYWAAYSGTTSPVSGHTIAPPPEGGWAATTDQTGPGTHILSQDVTVPNGTNTTLSFLVYYENRADAFYTPPHLSNSAEPNQQYRVDLMTTTSPIDSVAAGDVVANLFQTAPGAPPSLPPTVVCADVSPYAGSTLRLRFAQVDNQYYFQASIDAVAIGAECPESPPPAELPDLVVLDITMVPSAPSDGDSVVFRAEVHNQGTGSAGPTYTGFELDAPGGPATVVSTPALAPGETFVVETSPSPALTAGPHTITAFADDFGDANEANETNNALTEDFEVGPPPPPAGCPAADEDDFIECFDASSALPAAWGASGLWHVSDCRAASAPNSLAYNEPGCPTDYDNGADNSGSADTPLLLVHATPVVLGFDSWSSTECGPSACGWDARSVLVSVNGGGYVAVHSETDSPWTHREVPLAVAVGDVVHVRFAFSTGDASYNQFEGWYVDNVHVTNVEAGGSCLAPNDDRANATVFAGAGFSDSVSTMCAGTEPGEPTPTCGFGVGHTVWYSTTSAAGLLTIDTFGSDFDTVVQVWVVDPFGGLISVGCNDDTPGSLESRVHIVAVPTLQYLVQVGGYGNDSGSLTLNVT